MGRRGVSLKHIMSTHTLELDIDGIIILKFYCIFTTWQKGKQKKNCCNDVKCFLNLSTNIAPLFTEFQSIQFMYNFLLILRFCVFSLDQLRLVYKHQKVLFLLLKNELPLHSWSQTVLRRLWK